MNRVRVGGLIAGVFAVGLLTGLASTVVASDRNAAGDCAAMAEQMTGQGMPDMNPMMGGSMMSGSMAGPDASMGPAGPGVSAMPGDRHELHHPAASPELPQ